MIFVMFSLIDGIRKVPPDILATFETFSSVKL